MVSAVVPGIYIDYHLSLCETAHYHSVPGFTVYALIQSDPVAYLEYSCQYQCPLTCKGNLTNLRRGILLKSSQEKSKVNIYIKAKPIYNTYLAKGNPKRIL
jgi:hypothetical protein